jgi:DNA (cytosine-5)-methyltransferase 1
MKLYQEIIFLQHHCKVKYVVENVIPYYEPMFKPKKRGRHLYWSNFNLPNKISREFSMQGCNSKKEFKRLSKFHDYDFSRYNGEQSKTKIARNLVDYEAGKTILETALGIIKRQDIKQTTLF